MKTTDNSDSGVMKCMSQFVGLLDNRFRTLDRAEERNERAVLLLMQEVEVTARHHGRDTVSKIQPECLRVANIVLADMNQVEHIRLVNVSGLFFMRNDVQEQEVKMKLTLGVRMLRLELWGDNV